MSKEDISIIREITKESDSEAVRHFLINYFKDPKRQKRLQRFLEVRKEKGELANLKLLLESNFFQDIFKDRWEYESGPIWRNRGVEEAVKEASLHALEGLFRQADDYLEGWTDSFSGRFRVSRSEVKKIRRRSQLLMQFLPNEFILFPLFPKDSCN